MTATPPGVELNRAAIHAALAAWLEGRSSGPPALAHVANTLGRAWARTWARLRCARPDFTEAELDFVADETVKALASLPDLVVLLVRADAAQHADGGMS